MTGSYRAQGVQLAVNRTGPGTVQMIMDSSNITRVRVIFRTHTELSQTSMIATVNNWETMSQKSSAPPSGRKAMSHTATLAANDGEASSKTNMEAPFRNLRSKRRVVDMGTNAGNSPTKKGRCFILKQKDSLMHFSKLFSLCFYMFSRAKYYLLIICWFAFT